MTEKKNETINTSESNNTRKFEGNVEAVDVKMVMRGAEKIKSKYELLYEDIIEADEENK